MSHFAKVVYDKVVSVIVAEPEFFDTFVDTTPGEWIQTSYNTYKGVHLEGGTPLRGNFASIGGVYDREHDVFYEQQPFPSWTLNQTTWSWEAPVAEPTNSKYHSWNESTRSWDTPE